MKAHGKLLCVEMRYEDGTTLTLEGDAAETWRELCDSLAIIAYAHGMECPPTPWVTSTLTRSKA